MPPTQHNVHGAPPVTQEEELRALQESLAKMTKSHAEAINTYAKNETTRTFASKERTDEVKRLTREIKEENRRLEELEKAKRKATEEAKQIDNDIIRTCINSTLKSELETAKKAVEENEDKANMACRYEKERVEKHNQRTQEIEAQLEKAGRPAKRARKD
jgi:hypothetical protein